MVATVTVDGDGAQGQGEDAGPVAPVMLAVRTLTAARGGIEARLIEAAKVAVAAPADELLSLKGYVSVEELTTGQRTKLRTEAKAMAICELLVGGRYSREEARHLVGVACAPGKISALVIDALDRAWTTWWQVRLFWMRCAKLDPAAAQLVAQAMFGTEAALAAKERLDPQGDLGDQGWDHTQYRAALEREATRAEGADVEAERARRKAAYRARRVSITGHDDGTGTLVLTTDLVALCGIHTRIERCARLLRAGGDERTLDQLRADVCAALLLHGTIPALDKDEDDLTPGDLEQLGRILTAQPQVQVQVVLGWDALTGTPTCPHCGHTYTESPEDSSDPARKGATPDPGQSPASEGHIQDPGQPTTTESPPDPAARADHRQDAAASGSPSRAAPPVTVGGVAEILGRLGTFITPGHGRELVLRPGTTLVRLLMDPADGRLRERTIAAYRPDADMRRQIIAADLYSRAPAGRQPASSCELDHVIPWTGAPGGGPTGEFNLASAVKEFHEHKTKRRYSVTINERRDLTWTTLLACSVITREHDYGQYLDQILPDPHDPDPVGPEGTGEPGRRVVRPDLPPPASQAYEEVEQLDRAQFIQVARALYRQAATDSAPPTTGLPGHEEELKDAVRLRAAQALYAAIIHRGPDAFLEDEDDLRGADEGGPASGWLYVTHAPDGSTQQRPGKPARHPTPEQVLGLTPTQPPGDGDEDRSADSGQAARRDRSESTPWETSTDDPPPF